ncbi:hypothetical protein L1987_65544 [Smallanthus sonchifolius]|uniref:Uncharacterized protein n=1 Tax=Smallanthus sonchifolius TaxID=185202 RepID=A0ACB9BUT9_9ASTR|nr:hypothetical protein L1987_65544 [Smallanthus sonchifolius]
MWECRFYAHPPNTHGLRSKSLLLTRFPKEYCILETENLKNISSPHCPLWTPFFSNKKLENCPFTVISTVAFSWILQRFYLTKPKKAGIEQLLNFLGDILAHQVFDECPK